MFNRLLNNLNVELHLPKYKFCGPGTRLKERIARGDIPINPLDQACKVHDIAYSKGESIHEADKILQEQALQRVTAKDAKFTEKLAALSVAGAMATKRIMGMGAKKKKKRVLRIPKKIGGTIALLPIAMGVGSLASGAASIAQAIRKGKGFRLRPWKGTSIKKKKTKKKKI